MFLKYYNGKATASAKIIFEISHTYHIRQLLNIDRPYLPHVLVLRNKYSLYGILSVIKLLMLSKSYSMPQHKCKQWFMYMINLTFMRCSLDSDQWDLYSLLIRWNINTANNCNLSNTVYQIIKVSQTRVKSITEWSKYFLILKSILFEKKLTILFHTIKVNFFAFK